MKTRRASRLLQVVGPLAASALALAACSTPDTLHAGLPAPRKTKAAPSGPLCPLTGQPSPSGSVPQRPALAVKVDNYSAARPQSGLDHADIVFEEPVEGGITRYVAVFQCQEATLVGPIRSARNIDIGILGEFGHPLLVNVGGIGPVISNIEASPIIENDLRVDSSVVQNIPGRVAPYDTYASTAALWGLQPSQMTPPAPVFTYGAAVPVGRPATTISIPFSSSSDVTWNYDATTKQYLRFYGSMPDMLSDGVQNSAANVIVQFVQITYGPWLENDLGGLEVQANLYQDAGGQAEIFRNGVEVTGTWQRDALGQATEFMSSSGVAIALQPGRTWVELVPNTVAVTSSGPT
jgi:Protein of unknown function (DUF3048) N-terminal domain/Protein of unknown function (DUF3048) C-terminal domain